MPAGHSRLATTTTRSCTGSISAIPGWLCLCTVYRVRRDRQPERYLLKDDLDAGKEWDSVEAIAFFAIPPGYNHDGLIPILTSRSNHGTVLRSQPSSQAGGAKPLFYALPSTPLTPPNPQGLAGKWSCKAEERGDSDYASFTLDLRLDGEVVRAVSDAGDVQGTFRNRDLRLVLKTGDESYAVTGEEKEDKINGTWQSQTETGEHGTLHCERSPVVRAPESPAIVPLYKYADARNGSYLYSTDSSLPDSQLKRSAQPLCSVWRNPLTRLFPDPDAQPVPFRPPELPQSSGKAGD